MIAAEGADDREALGEPAHRFAADGGHVSVFDIRIRVTLS